MTNISMKAKTSLSAYNNLSTPVYIWGLEREAPICNSSLMTLHWTGVEVPVYCLVVVAVS